MAEAPGLLEGYQLLHDQLIKSSFDKDELNVVWQSINVEANCRYFVPAHTVISKMMKIDDDINEAPRDETPLFNARLEALRTFTQRVVRERGVVDEAAMQKFLDAGVTKRHNLEFILGVAQEVMSKYTNHLADTPLDRPYKKYEWHEVV